MKTVDYKSLLQQHKPKGYVSADANQIANRLICELSIQSGYGLALKAVFYKISLLLLENF